jgi:hypothetical protein
MSRFLRPRNTTRPPSAPRTRSGLKRVITRHRRSRLRGTRHVSSRLRRSWCRSRLRRSWCRSGRRWRIDKIEPTKQGRNQDHHPESFPRHSATRIDSTVICAAHDYPIHCSLFTVYLPIFLSPTECHFDPSANRVGRPISARLWPSRR